LKNELKDLEEKFRKAMVNNAGLDNEKSALTYQVELLKDQMEECEEQSALVTKELREKSRDFELLKRGHAETQRAVQLLQMQLDEQTRLISERGMVLIGNEDEEDNDFEKTTEEEQDKRTRGIVSSDTAAILSGLGSGPLDVRIKKLAEERDDLQDTLRRLKMDLDEEKSRSQRLERSPFNPEEAEWETKKVLDDYKFKLQKSEQDINTLQTNVARLDTQVIRFKTAAETAERSEEELKTERRKLQRENRESATRIEELETANKHLETRLGKLKTAKSNLLKDL
jgi:chromosome segregation ATPase